jgi:dihydroneopterin aldolase
MDKIYLHGLKCEATIGVWDWEKYITQSLIMDITLDVDARTAANSDSLDDALNYQLLTERITNFTETSRYKLLESLAEHLANMILQEFPVQAVSIKLDKGRAVKNVQHVGIMIERHKAD